MKKYGRDFPNGEAQVDDIVAIGSKYFEDTGYGVEAMLGEIGVVVGVFLCETRAIAQVAIESQDLKGHMRVFYLPLGALTILDREEPEPEWEPPEGEPETGDVVIIGNKYQPPLSSFGKAYQESRIGDIGLAVGAGKAGKRSLLQVVIDFGFDSAQEIMTRTFPVEGLTVLEKGWL